MAGLFRVKIFEIAGEVIVSICDEELLGKIIIDPERGVRIKIDEPFYGGELMDLEEAMNAIASSTQANLMGNRIVEAAIERGLTIRESVIVFGGIKHAQIVLYNSP